MSTTLKRSLPPDSTSKSTPRNTRQCRLPSPPDSSSPAAESAADSELQDPASPASSAMDSTESSVVSSDSELDQDDEDDEDDDEDDEDDGDDEEEQEEAEAGEDGGKAAPLIERLRAFLPQLRAANAALLEEQQRSGNTSTGFEISAVGEEDDDDLASDSEIEEDGATAEDEEEEGLVIEMNLGLGVLEERPLTPPFSPILVPRESASPSPSAPNFPVNQNENAAPSLAEPPLLNQNLQHDTMRAKKPKIEVLD